MVVSHRLDCGEDDYAAMLRMLIAASADPLLRAYCGSGDLDWWRAAQDEVWFSCKGSAADSPRLN